jgi:hypothetical protein
MKKTASERVPELTFGSFLFRTRYGAAMPHRLYRGAACPHCDEPLIHYGRVWTLFTRPAFLKCAKCSFIAWRGRVHPLTTDAEELAKDLPRSVARFIRWLEHWHLAA